MQPALPRWTTEGEYRGTRGMGPGEMPVSDRGIPLRPPTDPQTTARVVQLSPQPDHSYEASAFTVHGSRNADFNDLLGSYEVTYHTGERRSVIQLYHNRYSTLRLWWIWTVRPRFGTRIGSVSISLSTSLPLSLNWHSQAMLMLMDTGAHAKHPPQRVL